MIFLKRFVEILNEPGEATIGHIKKDNVYDAVQKAKVFVVRGHENSEGVQGDFNEEITPFSLPFEVCWFEVFDGCVAAWDGVPIDGTVEVYVVRGVLIEEVAPGCFNYAVLLEYGRKGGGPIVQQVITVHDGFHEKGFLTELAKTVKRSVLYIINRIKNTDTIGFSKTGERVKLKTSQGKVIHKIRKIIHIVPKKERGQSIPGEGEVEWTHRWLVMGHWRKLGRAGLGKDRSGNYCVKDFTWVMEHEKGPDDLPLVTDKVRVIHRSE
jgi:hypothetical protein